MTEPTTIHSVSMKLLRHWNVFRDLDEDGMSNIKSFYAFQNYTSRCCKGGGGMIIITVDDLAYGIGHNCAAINLLGFHNRDPCYRQEVITELSNLPALSRKKIAQVSIGGLVAAALSDCGTLYWWGNCYNYREDDMMSPHIPRTGRRRYLRVCCGHRFMAAMSVSGGLFVWGQVVPNATNFMEGERVNLNETIADISCGLHHMAMIDTSGMVYTWGVGDEGQRGFVGYTDEYQYRVSKISDDPCRAVKCGPHSTFCITGNYELRCCGSNGSLHLGLAQRHPVMTLTTIRLGVAVTHVYAVGFLKDNTAVMTARTSDGDYYTWGARHTAFPELAEAASFMDIFTSWQLTPELVSIRLKDDSSPARPLIPFINESNLMNDVLLHIYLKERPELSLEFARFRMASKSTHLAHLASQVTSEECGKAVILQKFLEDLDTKYQIWPCECASHCSCPNQKFKYDALL